MQLLVQYPFLPILSLVTAALGAAGLRARREGLLHAAALCLCVLLTAGLALQLPADALLPLPAVPLAVSLLLWKGDAP